MRPNRMDHRTLVASLTPEERAALTRPANVPGIIRLTLHGGIIVGNGWLIIERVPMWPLLMIVQGVAIIFLFTVLHETVHRTAFKERWLNDAVARLCGFLVVLPADWGSAASISPITVSPRIPSAIPSSRSRSPEPLVPI